MKTKTTRALRMAAVLAAGIATGAPAHAAGKAALADGYLCCNMRTDGSWISDSNYQETGKTMIPFGSPVKFRSFGRNRVNIEVLGKKQSIGNDYSRDLSIEEFGKRYIVTEDPRAKIAKAPARIRNAIEQAKVARGMTREQVLMALGYPITSETPDLQDKYWRFWLWSFDPFTVVFGGDGKVKDIEGKPELLRKVVAE